jgi:predicted ATPase/class 3 adenylate cyclase
MANPPPTGTTTFLFTDIEASTRLRQAHPEAFAASLALHHTLLRQAIETHAGYVFKIIGDAFCAAFPTALQALQAAVNAQQSLQRADWHAAPLRVRMGLHTGTADFRDGDYDGFALALVTRLMSAGHGGQVLLSRVTADLVSGSLPPGLTLRDLGQHRLKDVVRPEHIFQLLAPSLPADFPPLRTQEATPGHLPAQLTSFIGRDREIAEAAALLGQTRLLTLVGPGGTGKTRLSLQVAAQALSACPHGAWFVELAPLSDPDLVPQAVASALGLHAAPDRPILQTLADYLRSKSLLLVLDNCEHLVEACARLADHLLRAAPQLRILATSREALAIGGETSFPVPPLSLPDPYGAPLPPVEPLAQYEAVRLFLERARAVQPGFVVTDTNALAVAQICWRLDGIPLAIELAAARVRALSPQQIAARLDDRFHLLTGGSRSALPRHQTLEALIDWSYELLSDPERVLLRRVSVFAGGWTLEAAETVCAGDEIPAHAVLDLLSRLVEKSLVLAGDREGQARYWMLETIQQYARDKAHASRDVAAVRARHLEFCLGLAEDAERSLRGPEQLVWLNRLETEHNNLRASLGRAQPAGETEAGLRLAGALFWFWLLRGYAGEGRRWLEGMLQLAGPAGPAPLRAKAQRAAGFLAVGQGDIEAGRVRLQASLSLFRELADREGIADSLLGLGRAAYFQGDYAAALTLLEESLAECRPAGYAWGTAQALYRLGMVNLNQGDHGPARAHFEESVALFRALGDAWGLSYALTALGEEALRRGDYALAQTMLEESLALFQELGSKSGTAIALGELGWLALTQGDHLAARAWLEESLAVRRDMGHRVGISIVLNLLGDVALHLGEYDQARALIDQGLALRREAGSKSGIGWSLQNLGYLALRQGDFPQAAARLEESLRLFVDLGNKLGVAECLEGLAAVAAAQQPPEVASSAGRAARASRSLRLFGAAQALREQAGTPLPPYRRASYDQAVAAARASLTEPASAAAWAAGRGLNWEAAAAYALER